MSISISQKESATQARVTHLFTESLGYTYLGRWSDRPDNRNIEPALLRAFLLAQGVDTALADRAIFQLEQTANDRVQRLHDRNRAFALFATHYFELTEFPAKHRHALNMHVSAAESGDDIVFLHQIEAGPASRSYGVQVARLAGMPAAVLRQARQTLDQLEAQKSAGTPQIDLFATPPEPQPELQPELTPEPVAAAAAAVADPHAAAVLEAVRALDPDTLTPRSALDALYQLRALAARTPS